MAPRPYQIPSKACGCIDCIVDYPPAQYGDRPDSGRCLGSWQVRYRDDGRQRSKNFGSAADADRFLAFLRAEVARHGS